MLIFSFLLGTIALLLQGILLPRLAILAYAPWIALLVLKVPLSQALWLSALAGAAVDLISDDPMGLHALNYTLCATLLFKVRSPFSYDQPLHLSLFTGFISAASTILQWILLFLFDRRVPFEGRWVLADLVAMPVVDALYAFVWFAAPLALFHWLRRIWIFHWLKKKNLSQTSP